MGYGAFEFQDGEEENQLCSTLKSIYILQSRIDPKTGDACSECGRTKATGASISRLFEGKYDNEQGMYIQVPGEQRLICETCYNKYRFTCTTANHKVRGPSISDPDGNCLILEVQHSSNEIFVDN